MQKEELEFASASFEDQQERLREFGNKTREVAVEAINKLEAVEAYLRELAEAIQNNKAPPAYGPPKYPPIKDKETCEEKGGKWDEETKTCKFPPKKEGGEALQGLGVLPSSTATSNADARAKVLTAKVLGDE